MKLITIIFLMHSGLIFSQDFEKDYSRVEIEKNEIQLIEFFRIKTDSINTNTTLYESYFYDIKGRLIEKRESYNKDLSLYVSTKYSYENELKYTVNHNNPYILFGVPYKDEITSKTIYYINGTNKVDYINFQLKNGSVKKHKYNYSDKNLMIGLDIYTKDRLIESYFTKVYHKNKKQE